MTKCEALVKLLRHGAMTWGELLDCTRWQGGTLHRAIVNAEAVGWVRRRNARGGFIYELVEGPCNRV